MTPEKLQFIEEISNLADKALELGYNNEASILNAVCGASSCGQENLLAEHTISFVKVLFLNYKD